MFEAVSRVRRLAAALVASGLAVGCSGAQEAVQVELPVRVDARAIEMVETDLGYSVELEEARLSLDDLEFAVAGEAHAGLWRSLSDWLVPSAFAHPGHAAGGDVTGELPGHFVTSWLPVNDTPLGTATLLAGDYQSANFTFSRALRDDRLDSEDLLGHTAVLRGVAARGGVRRAFTAILDAPAGQKLIGVPFAAPVRAGASASLGLELSPRDPFEGDTLFDGIDFERLAAGANGLSLSSDSPDAPSREAQQRLWETFQSTDHFILRVVAPGAAVP